MTESFIDRREYARALASFVEAVPTGSRALWLLGDAGVGKTTLWDQGIRLAEAAGVRVLSARAVRAEAPFAFATLGDLLGGALDDALPRLPSVQRRALEVALLLREPEGQPPDARILGLSVLSVVRCLTTTRPLVLALDDVQWTDVSSAEVLAFMLRRLSDEPVGVLATVRGRTTDQPSRRIPPMLRSDEMVVEPLSLHETHRLLWNRFALRLTRPQLMKVHHTCGGNPFIALELGRAVVDGEVLLDGGPLTLPPRVSELVAQRLARLPRSVRATLGAVAAMGAPAVSVLEPLAPGVLDDLEHAQRRDLVRFDGDRIRFTHPLLASACYQAIPAHRRCRLHLRLAALDVGQEERARHLAMAATGPDDEIADALDTAATRARTRGAVQPAAELAGLSVQLTPRDSRELDPRRIRAAELCHLVGDPTQAGVLLQAVVDDCPPGPVRAQALGGLAQIRIAVDGFRHAEELYLRALDEPGVEPSQRARLLGELAWRVNAGGYSRRGIEYARSALEIAREADDPEVLAFSLATVAELTFWRTSRVRRDLLDPAVAIEQDLGYDVDCSATLARLLALCDAHREARAMFEQLIADARAQERGDEMSHLFFLARMESAAGAWDKAEEICADGLEIAGASGEESTERLFLATLAELDAYRGLADKARREIPEMRRSAQEGGFVGAVHRLSRALGTLELSCDRYAAASENAEGLCGPVAELGELQAQLAGAVVIESLIGLDRLPEAEALLTLLEERATEADSGLRLLAGRCRGVLQDAQGDGERAIETLAAAAADSSHERNALEAARTVLALGIAQRRARHKRDARLTLQRAMEEFDRLGATLWAEKARSELRRIGGRAASDEELSETERLIVELVVAGRRNREVADDLSLSPHTVAWNLSKIYRKLGVGSRTELAARMATSPTSKATRLRG